MTVILLIETETDDVQLMTTPHGSIRLQIILCRQVRSIALGQSAYGAAEEIAIVVDYVTDIHNHFCVIFPDRLVFLREDKARSKEYLDLSR